MTKLEIQDALGVSKWDDVKIFFANLGHDEIERKLNQMFPMDDNRELAKAITAHMIQD